MSDHKFDVKKLEKLNNPKRLESLNLDLLIKKLDLPENSTLVDIGTGTGFFAQAILDKLPSSSCIGFDISQDMLNWTTENIVPKFNSRYSVKLMPENEIPAEDNSTDLVFMIAVYHELDNPELLLKEVKRILKPTGKLLICDWKEGSHHHFVKKDDILKTLDQTHFKNIKEIHASEPFVCLISH
ncbi:MAG: class I SAM-dependent methyltransferase [Clostridium sp.]